MRLPDIPRRHRKLACAAAIAGTMALALVRRRDFAPEHERALRFGTALANAGLTWVTGSRAFLGHAGDPASIAEMFGAFEPVAGKPVRYSTVGDAGSSGKSFARLETTGEADSWWDEQAGVTSQSFINAATAMATGAASWALWPLTNRIVEAVDSRLPAGVGRGLSAAVNGGIVALTAVVVEEVGEWAADDGEMSNYAPVEIDLPAHIRASVESLLSQHHPVSQDTAEAVREQFESARFFVWVTYSDTLHSGSDPVVLEPEQLTQLLEEDISWIDVHPITSSPKVVPASQTYPVIGLTDTDSAEQSELSLEIVDGRLNRLDLSEPVDDETDDLLTAEALLDSVPGTLHPERPDAVADQIGSWSSREITEVEDEEELLTLDRWPGPEDLTIRIDRE